MNTTSLPIFYKGPPYYKFYENADDSEMTPLYL